MSSNDALENSIEPIIPVAKEGFSLINGTSQMCAFMCEALNEYGYTLLCL